MIVELYLASDLMIESTNKGVLEQIALVIERDFSSILGEHNCFLTGDLELDGVQPSFSRERGIA